MPTRKPLLPLEPVPDAQGVFHARRAAAAIKLNESGLALYSPVTGLNPDAIAHIKALGDLAAMIAPNHFYHLALKEYLEVFPDALL